MQATAADDDAAQENTALTDFIHEENPASSREWQALSGVAIAVAFVAFVTNLDLFLSVRGILPLNTLVVFVAFSAVYLGMVLAAKGRQGFDLFLFGLRLNRVPFGLFALWIIAHVLASGRTVLSGNDVDFTQIFPVFQFVVLTFGLLVAVADPGGRQISVAARWAIVVLGGSVIFETIFPGALGADTARTGGFALNANIPGFIIPALLALSLDFRRVRTVDLVVMLVSLVAVICTLSRMGIAMLALVIAVYGFFHVLRGGSEKKLRKLAFIALLVVGLTLLAVGSLALLASSGQVDGEFQARIAVLLHGGDKVFNDPYRGPLLEYFVHLASQHPWAGYGTGATLMNAAASAPLHLGPHNVYVRTWVDTGFVGMALYLAFVASIIGLGILRRSVSAVTIGTLVALYGGFSHNVTDNKAVLILVGVTLGLSAMRERER
ncbi:MAG: O-antigen ligase family protein [Tabrizicola sp.]|uniref:O-antigen ligase family protein n=1 Tax=Tabrizicola sp. TaxID=2005166 RepID=UPI0027335B43|nr:O-antigen ligase family protein [Tabrizicola sp.]MDP3265077.1 O-antigen ligase family protein [Tabrizicola sp.]MDP3647380.1 O-antigen ligase family protein [Paracoccaceae bacterium]MDZ4068631.1 O-antigen ligase family protein [Tabrizicola sp.]